MKEGGGERDLLGGGVGVKYYISLAFTQASTHICCLVGCLVFCL